MKKPYISVIIPAYNEELLLPRLLEELRQQTNKDFEVILIDANSNDQTVAIAKSYKSHFPLAIKHVNKKNISHSRNVGASQAKGSYLFFIDADNYVYPAFLKEMRGYINNGFELIIPAIKPDSRKIRYKISFTTVNFLVWLGTKFKIYYSTGGNLVIEKEAFQKLNGFDESIFVGEDHDIVERAQKRKFSISFVKNPKIVFSVRRLEKEGLAFAGKWIVSTTYFALFGKITKKIYNYQMGGDYYKKEPNHKL